MYNEEYEDEQDEIKDSNFIVNFYNNNKLLVWIFLGIIIFIIIMSLLTKGGSSDSSKKTSYEVVMYPEEEVVNVSVGTSTNLIATVKDDPNAAIIWSVEDDKIAKVDNGNVTGINYGKTKVTATYIQKDNEKKTATKEIVVADGDPSLTLTDVSFKEGDLFMPLNGTYRIALTLTPSKGYIENKEFTSSNTSVVTVDNTGLVTAVGEGEATISLNVNNGQFSRDLDVYVSRDYTRTEIIITPEKISLDGELRKIKVGVSERLTYTVYPENADKTKLTWKSSNESVLTVDENGRVKAIQEGRATITLSSINGIKDEIDIEVESDVVPVSEINLSMSDISLTVGQSQTITPIVRPDNASNKALSFVSLDSSVAVATANETGTQVTITGVSIGSTSIVIKSNNNIEKRLNVTVISSSGGGSSGGSSGGSGGSSGGSSSSQGFKITSKDANNEGYVNATYERTKPADNGATGPVTITVTKTSSSVSKLKVLKCTYPAGNSCNETSNGIITITDSDSFKIEDVGEYVIRVFEYDNNGNLSRTVDKFIWIKATTGGKTSTGSVATFVGKFKTSATAARLDVYTGSTSVTIRVNNSVGSIKLCYSKTNADCVPTVTYSSDKKVSLTEGLWYFNVIEVYSDGSTKKLDRRYVYVNSSKEAVSPSPTGYVEPTPTAPASKKNMSSLSYSCSGTTLVINDGNTTLDTNKYCGKPVQKRGNISMLYTYACKGDGTNYTGIVVKTCPEE